MTVFYIFSYNYYVIIILIYKSGFVLYSTLATLAKAHHFRCAFSYLFNFCLTYSYITIPAATEAFKLSVLPNIGIIAFSSAIS